MKDSKKIHFVGIGGIGVSALARAFLHKGWKVSGSDTSSSKLIEELKKEGIKIYIGHRAENLSKDIDLVVRSLAVPENNEEVAAARRHGVVVQTYPEALGKFARQFVSIAVSGMHGKTTTTAMLAHILVRAGLDPTVIVGTKLPLFNNSNFRFGKSNYFLFEADEYGRAFLNYYPDIAVILNTDKEHLDIYKDIDDVRETFARFSSQVPAEGSIVVNEQDDVLKVVQDSASATIVRFHPPKKRWDLAVAGEHNQLNAEAAWRAAKILGVKKKKARRALKEYSGAWRRMERLDVPNLLVYSDYAHHPVEVQVTIKAFREAHPRKRLLIVFQPHQVERLTKLFDDFADAFGRADEVWLLPAYEVPGREYEGKKKTSRDLVSRIPRGHFFENMDDIFRHIKRLRDPQNFCVVFMGAGDIDTKTRSRLRKDQ